jgi:hypothetical protein
MKGRGCCGRWAVDDDEEIERLLRELGLELPDVADDAADDALPSRLDDADELGDME